MSCYRKGGCGPYEMRPCAECPASKPEYATKEQEPVTNRNGLSGWISVEDRLPKGRKDVLVVAFWHECWQPMTGWYSDMTDRWRIITPFGEKEPGGVTHWMPLPEPPEVEG